MNTGFDLNNIDFEIIHKVLVIFIIIIINKDDVNQLTAILRSKSFPYSTCWRPSCFRVIKLTFSEGAKQKATVSKLKSFEGHLIYGVSKGQVKIVDGGLVRGNSFDSHRLKDISIFSNNFFTKNLANFANAKNAE